MKLSYRYLLLLSCVAFCFFVQTDLRAGELPSEAELPGSRLRNVDPRRTQLGSLPPESALPSQVGGPNSGEPANQLGAQDLLAQNTNENLPGENLLPPQLANPPRQADVNQADVPHKGAEDLRPWLALRTQAPLGMTRCLTFTPDSRRLCVGGDDKSVLVYRAFQRPGDEPTWGYERTIRWQVQRGPRGRINAMDAAGDHLAIAGLSAMGEAGNIVLVNPATGRYGSVLADVANGHVERVTSLAFTSEDASGLASMDVTGKLLHWKRDPNSGSWSATKLAEHQEWKLIKNLRSFHPIVAVADGVIAPRFTGTSAKPEWEIVRYPVAGGRATPIGKLRHAQMVTAIAADAKTGVIATAGLLGEIYLTVNGRQHRVAGMLPGQVAVALEFTSNGQELIVTSTDGKAEQGSLQVYDVSDPAAASMRQTLPLTGMPLVATAPSGKLVASATKDGVNVHRSDSLRTRVAEFRSAIPSISGVAFSTTKGDYRIAITPAAAGDDRVRVFDTKQLRLTSEQRSANSWSNPKLAQQGWKVETRAPIGQPNGRPRVMLTKNGAAVCPVPLIAAHNHTAEFWIAGSKGEPAAVAIGTSGQHNIYVFDLTAAGKCKLMREFRGHTGAVECLGLSADQKYLVSGSEDRTVRIWPLDATQEDRNSQVDRWGARFLITDVGLTVDQIEKAGPLYLRGVRAGDVITRLRIPRFVGNEVQVDDVVGNDAMLKTLDAIAADRLLGFEYRRGRTPQTAFQVFSAWPPLASLFVAVDNEWAYWMPSGFYDASFEGHRMFGWQVNRGVTRAPDYFLAEQVRKSLERPELMSKLLDAGNVEDAFRGASLRVPANSHAALKQQLQMAPKVTILSPTAGAESDKRSLQVKVSIVVPAGQAIVPPKLFANGVVAGGRRLVSQNRLNGDNDDDSGGRLSQVYQWQASMPSERDVTLQAIAATESEVVGRDSVTIRNRYVAKRVPRLYLAAAAVGDYQDSQIPRLEAVVSDTKRLLSSLKTGANNVYEPIDVPFFENVTRTGWNVAMDQLAMQMKEEAHADDLLVILLSGHGVRDEQSDEYYYLPADADFSEVMSRQYDKCISSSDLARFSDISCRKLVILDTCHSGAVRPLRQRQLKSALRALQDDMIFTLTASQGDQVAVQSRFARRLDEALRGAADRQTGNGNGTVTLDELGKYVQTMVMADSAGDANVQIPMLGPRELVQRVRFPLTSSAIQNASR